MYYKKDLVADRSASVAGGVTYFVEQQIPDSLYQKSYHFERLSSPLPVPLPVRKGLAKHAGKNSGVAGEGLYELREAIAQSHSGVAASPVLASQVCLGMPLNQILRYFQDTYQANILLPVPCFELESIAASILPKYLIQCQTDTGNAWQPKISVLEEILEQHKGETQMLFLPHPVSGKPYSLVYLKAIHDLMEKHDLFVIQDISMLDLCYTEKASSILAFSHPRALGYASLDFRFSLNTWGLSYLLHPRLLDARTSQMLSTWQHYSNPVPACLQWAAIEAFSEDPEMFAYQKVQRSLAQSLVKEAFEFLSSSKVACQLPQAGFTLFLDFEKYRSVLAKKGIYNSADLCRRIHSQSHVLLTPGSSLGAPPSQLLLALSLLNWEGETVLEKACMEEINPSFLYRYCWNSIEGVQKLMRFVQDLGC